MPKAYAAAKTETAALSRVDLQAQWAAELPNLLSAADVALYQKIFALQRDEHWAAADREIAKLKDKRLLGHVLAQRYLAEGWRSSYPDLAAWLKDHADHPDAPALYALAVKRAPKKGAAPLRRPASENLKAGWFVDDEEPPQSPDDETPEIADAPSPPGQKLIGEAGVRATGIKGQISTHLRRGDLRGAETLLRSREASRLLSDGEYDYWKARVAAGWFAQGDDGRALELAREAASRSGAVVPRANWIAGLALYKQGRFLDAARYFEALARTPGAQPWDLSAGAFWAGRSYLQGRKPQVFNYWTLQAAEYPHTFYGLLAARTMSVTPNLVWDPPTLSRSDVEAILRTASGSRAFALIEVDEHARAEREFARLRPSGGPGLTRALLGVAMRAGMPQLSIRLGRELSELDGRRHDGALYPIPPYRPKNGFEIDPALVYAVMRQESAFNPRARSRAGARGLMQLMPGTAQLMDSGKSFRGRLEDLYEPGLNVALGQKYLKFLLDEEVVQGDLIRLAAAYNGGPGNLAKWKRKQDMRGDPADDALLFIETIPSPETRHYITRVLYNYWMYSQRLGHPTPSLDLIAAGDWPSYAPSEPVLSPPTAVAAAPARAAEVASLTAPAAAPVARPAASEAAVPQSESPRAEPRRIELLRLVPSPTNPAEIKVSRVVPPADLRLPIGNSGDKAASTPVPVTVAASVLPLPPTARPAPKDPVVKAALPVKTNSKSVKAKVVKKTEPKKNSTTTR
jgi:soluble lytic murein transglycosylase-like protein